MCGVCSEQRFFDLVTAYCDTCRGFRRNIYVLRLCCCLIVCLLLLLLFSIDIVVVGVAV